MNMTLNNINSFNKHLNTSTIHDQITGKSSSFCSHAIFVCLSYLAFAQYFVKQVLQDTRVNIIKNHDRWPISRFNHHNFIVSKLIIKKIHKHNAGSMYLTMQNYFCIKDTQWK